MQKADTHQWVSPEVEGAPYTCVTDASGTQRGAVRGLVGMGCLLLWDPGLKELSAYPHSSIRASAPAPSTPELSPVSLCSFLQPAGEPTEECAGSSTQLQQPHHGASGRWGWSTVWFRPWVVKRALHSAACGIMAAAWVVSGAI